MDYSAQTTEMLRKELAEAIDLTEASVKKACAIIGVLSSRGENHRITKSNLFRWYRQVNSGKLSVSALIAFAGENSIIQRILHFPQEQQNLWADGEPIEYKTQKTDGSFEVVLFPIERFNVATLDLVFDDGKLRSLDAQEVILRRKRNPSKVSNTQSKAPTIEVAGDKFKITGSTFTTSQLMKELAKNGYYLVPAKMDVS